jgi:hypothetical protein
MIVLAAFVLGIFILFSTGVLVWTIKDIDKVDTARHATMKCLLDLVERLNKEFPGSHLIVQDTTDEVKVIGELKFYKK